MQLFDTRDEYWVIKNNEGKYWSSRDQKWMGFTRATFYESREKAEKNLYSISFLFKFDVEKHDPKVVTIKVEEE